MIGAGIFVLPSQLAPFGWTGVAAWLVAIPGTLVLAYVLSRLSSALPEATGIIAIVATALGPLAGVLVGWSYWVSVWCANAIIALTAARYLAPFLPGPMTTPTGTALTAIGLLWLITLLNLAGARSAGRFQVLTTILKLLPLGAVILILAGLLLGADAGARLSPQAPFHPGQLTTAITLAFYALVGFEAATVAAARVRNPAVNIARATMVGTGLTGLIYLLVCTGIIFTMPLAVLTGASAPVALFIEQFLGRGAGLVTAAFIAISAIGALNCWVLMQGEVPLGMARAGLLPRWFARVSSRDVSVRSLLLAGVLASLLMSTNASRSTEGLLQFMLQLTAAASLWVYAGAAIGALVLGIARPFAAVGLLFAGWAMWGAGLEAVGLSLGLMLSALPLYLLRSGNTAPEPAE